MKNKGFITISRPVGQGEYISITIGDCNSGIEFVELNIDLDWFTKAITGQTHVLGALTVKELDLVGKKREHKTELINVTNIDYGDKLALKQAMEVFHLDGWKGRIDDMSNGHKRVRKGDKTFQEVVFIRYV